PLHAGGGLRPPSVGEHARRPRPASSGGGHGRRCPQGPWFRRGLSPGCRGGPGPGQWPAVPWSRGPGANRAGSSPIGGVAGRGGGRASGPVGVVVGVRLACGAPRPRRPSGPDAVGRGAVTRDGHAPWSPVVTVGTRTSGRLGFASGPGECA